VPGTLTTIPGLRCRRNIRHTTHLDGYPEKVEIIRYRHPLQWKILEVLGWHHREDILYLTLILPDGSRSFIPAAWTNLHEICPQKSPPLKKKPKTDLIATAATFSQVRKIVDALLGKPLSTKPKLQTASREENSHAKTAEPLAHPGRIIPNSRDLASPRSAAKKPDSNGFSPHDPQNSLPGESNTK
jgi:hypothetical protein